MNRETAIEEAKEIMGSNFIGPKELRLFGIKEFKLDKEADTVPFSKEKLLEKKEHYLLIYGASEFADETPVNIQNLKQAVMVQHSNPTFYNQDWYDKEDFIETPLEEGWFFIRKDVYEDSRAINPDTLMKSYAFPSAIKCTYSFFVAWICADTKLWYEDFVWCSDVDHNGDRIYVGKYHDVDGINNDGFSIHRHLALRKCYTCID